MNLLSNLIGIALLLFLAAVVLRLFTRQKRGEFPQVRPGAGRNTAAWTRENFLGADHYAREAAAYVTPEHERFRPAAVNEPVLNVASWVPITLLALVTLAIAAAGAAVQVHPVLIAILVPALLALYVMFTSPSDL